MLKKRFLSTAILWVFAVLLTTSCSDKNTKKDSPPNQPSSDTTVTGKAAHSWISQVTPLENIESIVTPEEDHTKLVQAFQSAQKSIKIGTFGISSKQIVEILVQQVQRGIEVKIICDSYCVGDDKKKALIEQLTQGGVDVHFASSGFSIAHWKMFIIDEKKAFISTMNLITRMQQMRDIGIFTDEPSIVQEMLAVFNQDLENSKNQTALTPLLSSAHLVWSPVNSEQKLIDLINFSKKSIEVWIENLGHQGVHQAFKNAVQRGVHVRILTSICGLGMGHAQAYKNYADLMAAGVVIQGMPYPATQDKPYIHAKTIHVDKSIFFLGSENFSYNSIMKARELGIVLKSQKFQDLMDKDFEKDWKNSQSLPSTPPDQCESLTPTNTGSNFPESGFLQDLI